METYQSNKTNRQGGVRGDNQPRKQVQDDKQCEQSTITARALRILKWLPQWPSGSHYRR